MNANEDSPNAQQIGGGCRYSRKKIAGNGATKKQNGRNLVKASAPPARRSANAISSKALAQRGKFGACARRAGGPRAERTPARAGFTTATTTRRLSSHGPMRAYSCVIPIHSSAAVFICITLPAPSRMGRTGRGGGCLSLLVNQSQWRINPPNMYQTYHRPKPRFDECLASVHL